MVVSEEMRDTALHMLGQLKRQRLTVELAPSMDYECALRGGKIRVVAERNMVDHLPFLQSVEITAVEDLGRIIDDESGGLVLSEVML